MLFKRFLVPAVAVFLFSNVALFAQVLSLKQVNKKCFLYQKVEWQINVKGNWINPYNQDEVVVDMHFTTPSGKQLTLPCFYVSGNSGEASLWAARFAPTELGKYTYYCSYKNSKGLISQSKKLSFIANPSKDLGFLRMNTDWTFKTDNGALFRGIGENIGWESRDTDDSKYFKALHENPRFNYDFMLKKLAQNGGNFFRTWMIYWNLPVDWKQVQNNKRYVNSEKPFNPSGMERLDHVVQLFDSLGIYMMLALESHVGLMGTGWETSSYNVKNGGFAVTPTDFFTSPNARKQYKNKLRLMVARYGYSPSIGAWEFFNEVDNAMYQGKPEDYISHIVVSDWHREMSSYLKSIDPFNHIVTTSISHREIEGLNEIPTIDFNQKHIYCNTLAIPEVITTQKAKYNKPYVIGEAGYHWDWSIDFNKFGNEFDSHFKLGLWLGIFSPTPVLPMSWWWEFFEDRGMMSYFKHIKAINDIMLADSNGSFDLQDVQCVNPKIQCYLVKGKSKSFLLVVNTSAETQTSTIQFANASNLNKNGTEYDTKDGVFKTIQLSEVQNNKVSLEALTLEANQFCVFIF
jgi:hypothetical protein